MPGLWVCECVRVRMQVCVYTRVCCVCVCVIGKPVLCLRLHQRQGDKYIHSDPSKTDSYRQEHFSLKQLCLVYYTLSIQEAEAGGFQIGS